jgi:DNA-binding transcriptional regulator YiaG
MNYSRIHTRTLEKAAQILGGQAELARHLHVGSEELAAWMEGRSELPTPLFIAAVDVIAANPHAPLRLRRSA